jgi:hypothetical protein
MITEQQLTDWDEGSGPVIRGSWYNAISLHHYHKDGEIRYYLAVPLSYIERGYGTGWSSVMTIDITLEKWHELTSLPQQGLGFSVLLKHFKEESEVSMARVSAYRCPKPFYIGKSWEGIIDGEFSNGTVFRVIEADNKLLVRSGKDTFIKTFQPTYHHEAVRVMEEEMAFLNAITTPFDTGLDFYYRGYEFKKG